MAGRCSGLLPTYEEASCGLRALNYAEQGGQSLRGSDGEFRHPWKGSMENWNGGGSVLSFTTSTLGLPKYRRVLSKRLAFSHSLIESVGLT